MGPGRRRVLDGEVNLAVQVVEERPGDHRSGGVDEQRRHNDRRRGQATELVGRRGRDGVGAVGLKVHGGGDAPSAQAVGGAGADRGRHPVDDGRQGDTRVCLGLGPSAREGGDDRAGEGRLDDVGVVRVAGGEAAVAGRGDHAGDAERQCRHCRRIRDRQPGAAGIDDEDLDGIGPLLGVRVRARDRIGAGWAARRAALIVPADGGVPSPQSIVAVKSAADPKLPAASVKLATAPLNAGTPNSGTGKRVGWT